MLSRLATPLSWRVFRSRTRLIVELTSCEKAFLNTVVGGLRFPFAIGPHAATNLARTIMTFVGDYEIWEKRRHLELCKAWSLLPDKQGRVPELLELAVTLRSCSKCDVYFRVILK